MSRYVTFVALAALAVFLAVGVSYGFYWCISFGHFGEVAIAVIFTGLWLGLLYWARHRVLTRSPRLAAQMPEPNYQRLGLLVFATVFAVFGMRHLAEAHRLGGTFGLFFEVFGLVALLAMTFNPYIPRKARASSD